MDQKTPSAPLVKFKTGYDGREIERVEVLRETAQSVFLPSNTRGERREAKSSDWSQYHDSWADAHAYLMSKAQSEVELARLHLEKAKGRLGNIKGMKPPKENE